MSFPRERARGCFGKPQVAPFGANKLLKLSPQVDVTSSLERSPGALGLVSTDLRVVMRSAQHQESSSSRPNSTPEVSINSNTKICTVFCNAVGGRGPCITPYHHKGWVAPPVNSASRAPPWLVSTIYTGSSLFMRRRDHELNDGQERIGGLQAQKRCPQSTRGIPSGAKQSTAPGAGIFGDGRP